MPSSFKSKRLPVRSPSTTKNARPRNAFRPGLERLEARSLLTFTPLNYAISAEAMAGAQAAGGYYFSFDFPGSYSVANSFPGSYAVNEAAAAASVAGSNSANASSQSNITETESANSDGSQSGVANFNGSFTNQIQGAGYDYSDENVAWSYEFNSDTYFNVNMSYTFTWNYSYPGGTSAQANIGSLTVTNVDTAATIINTQFYLTSGQTLSGMPTAFVPAGDYMIKVTTDDNGVLTPPGVAMSSDTGTVNWSIVPDTPTLTDVTFAGEGGRGFYPIASDPAANGAVNVYRTEQWDSSFTNQEPVLYAAGSTPSLTTVFTLTSSQPLNLKNVEAQAFGPDGFEIEPTGMNIIQLGNELTLQDANMNQSFDPSLGAEYYADFSIDWQLSFDGGNNWADIGTTDNHLYVSAATPAPDPSTGYYFLTVVNNEVMDTLGVMGTDTDGLIQSTWSNSSYPNFSFASTTFTNAARDPLHYYASKITQNLSVESLLQFGDAGCGAWAGLFLDMLLISGVDPANDFVTVKPGTSPEKTDFTSGRQLEFHRVWLKWQSCLPVSKLQRLWSVPGIWRSS